MLKSFEQANNAKLNILKSGDAGAALNKAILAKGNPLADVFYGVATGESGAAGVVTGESGEGALVDVGTVEAIGNDVTAQLASNILARVTRTIAV